MRTYQYSKPHLTLLSSFRESIQSKDEQIHSATTNLTAKYTNYFLPEIFLICLLYLNRQEEKLKLLSDLKEAQQRLDDSVAERNRLRVLEEVCVLYSVHTGALFISSVF